MVPKTRTSPNVGPEQNLLTDPHLFLYVVVIVEYEMMGGQMDCPSGRVSRLRTEHSLDLGQRP